MYNTDKGIKLINPISNLTQEEAIMQFNESFVSYLLYSIKAYNLHNPPLSSDTPKIKFLIGDDSYNAEIIDGLIKTQKIGINNEDIQIITTKSEAVKMLRDRDYVEQSFKLGNSRIELIAGKTTLFSKGYLNLYTKLTGKSVTGNTIRIYMSN